MTEEEQIALAIQMSMNEASDGPTPTGDQSKSTAAESAGGKPMEMETDVCLFIYFHFLTVLY